MLFYKKLSELTDSEIINIHLSRNASTKDFKLISTLKTLEEEMRQSSGLDKFKSFLPFMAAFAILDQIGKCYENSEKKESMAKIKINGDTPNAILKALYYFGDIEDEQTLNEIRIFRNSIVHDASLFIVEKNKINEINEYYCFRYSDNNETSNLINSAEEKWDGNFDSISPKNVTIVNRKVLINKTSDIIRKLSKINESNELKISLPDKEKELINRYFLMIPRN
ncbi:hypothetical protein [Trichormus variabilis]|uniref:Uncharacterized protein n=1 Tax=Trichormus variabilis SAG 1403-4b TaxID=447716 RepID=A0A433UFH4_ANAVA|nr:hypothetical protein [Trichormus variabilis]MBD2629751.1 hypothetical protein [Trichormus variabilis FACHB-164]RUS92570.1 hypothetical protein DSM107003_49500 [Trichormus variabilis SAG 1403-4b]